MLLNHFHISPCGVFSLETIKEKIRRIPKKIKVVIVAGWFAVIESGWFPHRQREFHCKDPALSFKYNGDTITAAVLILSTFFPFFILWITEAIYAKPTNLNLSRTRKSLKKAFHWFKKYYVGIIVNLVIVQTVKVTIGGLRPHFLNTCRPDVMDFCQPGEIIFRYACNNKEQSYAFVRDSQKSFPSGHSSLAFFEAIFIIWYFHKRVPKLRCMLFMPLIYTLCISWAFFVSASRITDHRHHWYDVLAGVIFGIVLAYLTCMFHCNNFKGCKNTPNPEITPQNGVPTITTIKDREETSRSAV